MSVDDILQGMRDNPHEDWGLEDFRTLLEGHGFVRSAQEEYVLYRHDSLPAGGVVAVPKDRHRRNREHVAGKAVAAVDLVLESAREEP